MAKKKKVLHKVEKTKMSEILKGMDTLKNKNKNKNEDIGIDIKYDALSNIFSLRTFKK